jgi:urease subunit alpha
VKPEIVMKGGMIAWAQMGDPNATISTPEPVYMRPMFATFGKVTANTSVTFVSQGSLEHDIAAQLGLNPIV